MLAPDPRHLRRSQADSPLIALFEFGQPPLNVLRRVMGLVLGASAVNMVLSAVALWLHLPEI